MLVVWFVAFAHTKVKCTEAKYTEDHREDAPMIQGACRPFLPNV